MPSYEVTAPDGRKLRLTGDTPPTDTDLDEIFAGLPVPKAETQRRSSLFTDPRLDPAASDELTDEEVAGAEKAKAAGLAGYGTVASGAVPTALRLMGNPVVAGGVGGALEYAHSGDAVSAGKAAVANALMSRIGTAAVGAKGLLARIAQSALARGAAPAVEAAAEVAPAAYRGIPSLMKVAGPVAEDAAAAVEAARAAEGAKRAGGLLKSLAPKAAAAPVAEEAGAARTVAKATEAGDYMSAAERATFEADRTARLDAALATRMGKTAAAAPVARAGAAPGKAVVDFAKEIAKGDPKVGEKIWILLDDAGAPVKRLTSDQAATAARKGLQTTWVKNLW